jgi:hypothetical protein
MDIQAMQSMDWLFKKERIYLLAQFWQQVSPAVVLYRNFKVSRTDKCRQSRRTIGRSAASPVSTCTFEQCVNRLDRITVLRSVVMLELSRRR